MVIKNSLKEDKSLEALREEISILYELGVDGEEIKYLVYLKTKKDAGLRWKT